MDQTRKARLEAGGIMVDEALERFMGNEAMLERYFTEIPQRKELCHAAGFSSLKRLGSGWQSSAHAEKHMWYHRM